MKVLITGNKGQVGYCLTQQLSGKADTLAIDRDELDITDQSAVFTTVETFRPDVIINAAAHTAVDRAEAEIELSQAINVEGPRNLALAAEKIGAAILHISTDYVFSGEGSEEYKETDPVDPQGVYGQTKLDGERAVQQACSRSIILRTAWVFGEYGNNFVKTMLRLGTQRDSLSIVGDQFGGPTYAGDIASALICIATQIAGKQTVEYGIYHFSGMPYVSWFEFAQAIFKQAKEKSVLDNIPNLTSITTEQYPTPAKRPANSRLNLDKIEQAFNIEPSDWQSALKNITAYTDGI